MTARTFTAKPATREQVPLLIGLVGPSGSGKTYSALRLAEGIRSVVGGEVFVIDTEARRALHYADQFAFQHVEFGAPFGSLDYLSALQFCASQRAGVIVVDSMSHEHEGPGGVLEGHEAELTRIAGDDQRKRMASNMLAWAKPKAARRALINSMMQMSVPAMIFCFRAKEKVKLVPGKQPEQLGWMPIAGEEFIYEMTLNALLLPASTGKPTWQPEERGERSMVKLPRQFMGLTGQLTEEMGADMARWAAGVAPAEQILRAAAEAGMNEFRDAWAALPPADKARLAALKDEMKRKFEAAQAAGQAEVTPDPGLRRGEAEEATDGSVRSPGSANRLRGQQAAGSTPALQALAAGPAEHLRAMTGAAQNHESHARKNEGQAVPADDLGRI